MYFKAKIIECQDKKDFFGFWNFWGQEKKKGTGAKRDISDPGFYHNKGFRLTPNKGSIYENIVAIELNRRAHHKNMELYYWQDSKQYEVDFVVKQGLEIKQLIQVCYNLNDENTKKREMRALLHASKELGCKNLLIISEDREGEEEIEWFGMNNRIKFQSLWKWLLE